MNPRLLTTAKAAASIDFPSEGELVFSPHYSVRVSAQGASSVEVSMDGGDWKPARLSDGFWWHDWTGYGSGGHVVCARVLRADGMLDTLRPRTLRVALAPTGAVGMQDRVSASTAAIGAALGQLRNQKIEFVQLWFTDIGGKPWRIGLPVEHLDEEAFTAGVTLDGQSTARSFRSYITLLPDPTALFIDPLAKIRTAAIFCDIIEPTDSAAAALGVRHVLAAAVAALGEVEPGLTATVGAEPEFFLLDAKGEPAPEESVWDFICEMAKTLGEAGIKPEGFRFGPARGQGRVQMRWADPVRTADHVMLYRWFARTLAHRRGQTVSFQPHGGSALGMPVHHSLWLGVENVFHDANGWRYTSDRCRWYAGGLLRHGAALSAFVATTEGSYPQRGAADAVLLKPYLTSDDPAALVRVPERHLNASGRRLKFRGGNANANPYLSLAATILAGVDGLRHKIEPEIDESSASLPASLEEALQALDGDRDFLRRGSVSDRVIDAWITERRAQPERAALEG